MTLSVIRLLVVQRLPNLIRDRSAEHVQDFVSLIPRVEKPHRRLPHLRRRVVPQLRRDNLVHRKMQTRIHRPIADIDLVEAIL